MKKSKVNIILILFVGFVLLSFFSILIKVLFFPVKVANNVVNTAYDVNSKTINANNAVYNYEWFKQQYEDISKTKSQIEINQKSLDDFRKSLGNDRTKWTFEDKNEESRLQSIVTGLRNQLENLVADYNARAKMANRNIFADKILPDYIDALTFMNKN